MIFFSKKTNSLKKATFSADLQKAHFLKVKSYSQKRVNIFSPLWYDHDCHNACAKQCQSQILGGVQLQKATGVKTVLLYRFWWLAKFQKGFLSSTGVCPTPDTARMMVSSEVRRVCRHLFQSL